MVNLAAVVVDFKEHGIFHLRYSVQRLYCPTIGRLGIHNFSIVVLALGLETRIDDQSRGIHRFVLVSRGEVDMTAQHLGISFVQTDGIIVDFVQSGEYTLSANLIIKDFSNQTFQFIIAFGTDILFIAAFTHTTHLVLMVRDLYIQCGSGRYRLLV